MNIIPELNLNKHPKDCKNLSLVNAQNIKLSNDLSCLQNENQLINHTDLNNAFRDLNLSPIWILPCNKELIVFCGYTETDTWLRLLRYNEETEYYHEYDLGIEYASGEFTGTFTYNAFGDLIISFSEYDCGYDRPLRTVNLGRWDGNDIVGADEIDDKDKTPLCPEVLLPTLNSVIYSEGKSYKGWYHFFIRYKINKSDYTQWFSFGYPVLVDTLDRQNIIKYHQYVTSDGDVTTNGGKQLGAGCSDYFNSNDEICNETVELNILNIDLSYSHYQIGYIITKLDSTKAFRTADIATNNGTYKLNQINNINYNVEDFITEYNNYYDVKEVINYNNRLYISNYKELELSDDQINDILNSIEVTLNDSNTNYIEDDSFREASNDSVVDYEDLDSLLSSGFTIDAHAILYTNGGIALNGEDVEFNYPGIGINYGCYINVTDSQSHISKLHPNKILVKTLGIGANVSKIYYTVIFTLNGIDYKYYIETQLISSPPPYYKEKVLLYTEGITTSISVIDYDIEDKLPYINTNHTFNERKTKSVLIPGGIYSLYIHFVDKYGHCSRGYHINNIDDTYKVSNSKGDILLEVPIVGYDSLNIPYCHNDEKIIYRYPTYKLKITVDNIPFYEGYGFFISYEKYIPNSITGLLCMRDNIYNADNDIDTSIKSNATNKMYFYSEELDISNKINLNYNKLAVVKYNPFELDEEKYTNFLIQKNTESEHFINFNVPEIVSRNTTTVYEYSITGLKLKLGGDVSKGRNGLGTCIELDKINELFRNSIDTADDYYKIYKVILYSDNTDIYLNENKQLIRLTDTIYENVKNYIIDKGYNGRLTFNNFLVYNNNGVKLDTYNQALAYTQHNGDDQYFYKLNNNDITGVRFIAYMQMPVIADRFFETKEFNNNPQSLIYRIAKLDDSNTNVTGIKTGNFVLPINSIDLFTDKYGSPQDYYPKYYSYYNPNIEHLIEFNKTVRRSAVIQDESAENSWRKFPLEAYKQISENKGIITNLVALGHTLLVHTEHSLFAFMNYDRLQTQENRTIQLETPDIFDITYQEILTSELGVCGLQDRNDYIVDHFGYFFFDRDAHRIYRFGQGKIEDVSKTIVQFLDKYKPTNIKFASDKESNRLLLNIHFDNGLPIKYPITLSYNYIIGNYISLHNYNFNRGFSTKNVGYLLTNSDIKVFNYNNLNNTPYANSARLDIICNTEYETIKVLEFISYKLYKVDIMNNTGYSPNPVEGDDGQRKHPYAGDIIRVFNDLINTDDIDVSVPATIEGITNDDYRKPYFDLGNWNLSYLRDVAGLNDEERDRLHGNYFIISFKFNQLDNQRIEFETLDCNIIKYR